MSRRHAAEKREVIPDAKYGDQVVAKFINCVMLKGNKATAESIVYGAFDLVEQKTKQKGIEVFNKALDNIMPTLELKVRRVAGSNYQVPTPVSEERKIALALR